MGVNGLWKVLEPCADYSETLFQLAARRYSSSIPHRGLRVGVDVSIWLVASKEVFSSTEGDVGPNPTLRDLFFKLCRLLRAGVLPLLVFDGRSKPKIKRGRMIKGTGFDPALTLKMKELINIMGMNWIEAAGEAEAELAELEAADILDAVITVSLCKSLGHDTDAPTDALVLHCRSKTLIILSSVEEPSSKTQI